MITTKLYLDTRAVKPGQVAPVRVVITKDSVRAMVPTNVSVRPANWDPEAQAVVGVATKAKLNSLLEVRKAQVVQAIFLIESDPANESMSAAQIKNRVLEMINLRQAKENRKPTVAEVMEECITARPGRTGELYAVTLKKLRAYDAKFDERSFEDITARWLERFDAFMAETSPSRNARNIHMRNIRCVFNRAIDDEITQAYPFRKLKLKPEATIKRAMSVEEIRKIIRTPLPKWMEVYRDMWVLSFCLVGINIADLCALTEIDGQGRIEYIRAKTKRKYSIKVEPEAMEIINRYRGKGQLLSMMDTHSNYRMWYNQLCRGLREVMRVLNEKRDGIVIKNLTSYWARHSWATTAALLDIPKETIAAGLGHGGNTVTDIYIAFDSRKVDAANRAVLDAVFNK